MNSRNLQFWIACLITITLVLLVFFVAKIAWISADAPYYLSVARDMSEGKTLFKDITTGYTPLVMTLFSYVYWISEHASLEAFMLVHLAVILLTGCILFFVFRRIELSLLNSFILSVVFCLAVLSSDGNYIVLESYSILFVVVAFLCLLNDRAYFLGGALLGCSFLCKQYGVLNFVPFFFYIISRSEASVVRIKKGFMLGSGGLFIFLLFVGYYVALKDVNLMEFVNQITGAAYSKYSLSKERTITSILIGGKVFLLFSGLLVFFSLLSRRMIPELKFCIIGILSCLLPVFLQGFQHYYINTFPYLFLGIGFVWARIEGESSAKHNVIVLFAVSIISSGLLFSRLWRYSGEGASQRETARLVSEYVPVGSSVFIKGDLRYLYILNNYRNAHLSTIGYNFLFNDVDSLLDLNNTIILASRKYPQADSIGTEVKVKDGTVFIYRPTHLSR